MFTPPPTAGIFSECVPGLPGGTSELKIMAAPFRMSLHRLNRSVRTFSSNFSTKTTFALFSIPTSPGYDAAIGVGGGGAAFDTVTLTAVVVV